MIQNANIATTLKNVTDGHLPHQPTLARMNASKSITWNQMEVYGMKWKYVESNDCCFRKVCILNLISLTNYCLMSNHV